MQRPGILRHLLALIGFMVFMAGCAFSPVQYTQTAPASSPVPSPSILVRQLKPENALPSSCPATPIYQGGPQGEFVTTAIPWVQAQPTSSGIVGHLFYVPSTMAKSGSYRFLHTGGSYPGQGESTKILWTIDHPQLLNMLQIDGTNLSDPAKTFHQTINSNSNPAAALSSEQFPSIVVVPSAGCWRLQITSGKARGSIIMWVVG